MMQQSNDSSHELPRSPAPWVAWVEGAYYRDPKTGEERLAWAGSSLVLDADGRPINGLDRGQESDGDAYLMAAAPLLLEALVQEHRTHDIRNGLVATGTNLVVDGCATCDLIKRARGQGFHRWAGE